MADKVLVTVLIKNNVQLIVGQPQNAPSANVREHLNCKNIEVIGDYWLVPVVDRGVLLYYKPDISATKPTIDSIRAIRVRDTETRTTYYVGVADATTPQDLIAKCNECCDSATAMPDVTVP